MKRSLLSIVFATATILNFSCQKMSLRGGGGSGSGGSGINGTGESTISSNFNGTDIQCGKSIWFNAHFKKGGNMTTATTVQVRNASINFSDGGTPYSLSVPDANVTYSPTCTTPTYYFDVPNQMWIIEVPMSTNKNVFFGGLRFDSPCSTGLNGGINPVKFSATFSSTTPGLELSWQWSAAVYTNFPTDYNALGLELVDGSGKTAGRPTNYGGNGTCVGGARGGGSSNLTGSWSATGHVVAN